MREDKMSNGYLSGSEPVRVLSGKLLYEFALPIMNVESVAFVFPVVYLSRDGSWEQRVKTALVDPIPMLERGPDRGVSGLLTIRARDGEIKREEATTESLPIRFFVAGIWITAAAVAGLRRVLSTWMAVGAAMAGIWEVLGLASFLAIALRQVAWCEGWYTERRGPQLLITVVAMGVLVAFALVLPFIQCRSRGSMAWLALTMFWGIALLRVLSLHELDFVLAHHALGLPLGQLAALLSALVCLLILVSHPYPQVKSGYGLSNYSPSPHNFP